MNNNDVYKKFYLENYDLMVPGITEFKQKLFFGDKSSKKCKFCNKHDPEVKFNYSSHAFSQALGNNTFFSFNECVECNRYFCDLENHVSNYLGLMRIILPIKNKKSSITLKTKNKKSQFDKSSDSKFINIRDIFDDKIAEVDIHKKEIRLKYNTSPFVPILAYKMFLKYAFSFMPESEVFKCNNLRSWLMDKSDKGLTPIGKPLPLYFAESFDKFQLLEIEPILFVKKPDVSSNLPLYSFILRVYNVQFQIFIPSDEQVNTEIIIPCPCFHYGFTQNEDLKARYILHDFSYGGKISIEQQIAFNFDKYETFEESP